jgi:hypothetical protein
VNPRPPSARRSAVTLDGEAGVEKNRRMAGKRVARAGTAVLLGLALLQVGCALLVPPGWRARAPIPLAGDMPPARSSAGLPAEELGALPDDELLARIQRDRERLVELAGQTGQGPLASPEFEREIREIAERLPVLQHEIAERGAGPPGSRIRHPVIR